MQDRQSVEPRHLLLHYHLFKNGGSTVDAVLQRHFGDAWIGVEGDRPWSVLPAEAWTGLLDEQPGLRAISSHQARMPPPALPGVRFHVLFFLRHPIDRAGSVYAFERRQASDSPGARAARSMAFAEYVDWRLHEGHGGVICNFQTVYLGWPGGEAAATATADDALDNAIACVRAAPFFGLVERFDASLARMHDWLAPYFGDIDVRHAAVNRSEGRAASLDERLAAIRQELGPRRYQALLDANALDLALHEAALDRFDESDDATRIPPA